MLASASYGFGGIRKNFTTIFTFESLLAIFCSIPDKMLTFADRTKVSRICFVFGRITIKQFHQNEIFDLFKLIVIKTNH
jgi:hypothetical protein